MMPDWVPVVQAKLVLMHRYVDELAGLLPAAASAYAADRPLQLAVERSCQLVVECATDTNGLVLAGLAQAPPAAARDGFAALESQGVLTAVLARQFRETFVGFRNRLVHDYDRIDNGLAHRTASRLVQAGRDYIAAVGALVAASPSAP